MDNVYARFGDLLYEFIQCKELSLTDVSKQLGYKSKTSLARILRNEANEESNTQCLERLYARRLISGEEKTALQKSIEIARMGAKRYEAWQAVEALIYGRRFGNRFDFGEQALKTLKQALSPKSLEKLQVLVLNCCWPELFEALFSRLPHGAPTAIEHYFSIGQDVAHTMRSIASLATGIGKSLRAKFQSHAFESTGEPLAGLLTNNMMLVKAVRNGKTTEQILFFEPLLGFRSVHLTPGQGFYDSLVKMLEGEALARQRATADYSSMREAEDLIRLSELHESLEWKRNMYIIEPDLCIHCVSPDIILRAVDMKKIAPLNPANAQIEPMMLRFYQSHARRYKNIFENKCAKHFVLSKEHVRGFAMTGMLSVHMYVLRAFTIKERLQILKNCLWHLEHDAFFNIYFWNDGEEIPVSGFACNDPNNIQVFIGQTRQDPEPTIDEIFLEDGAMADLFRDYIREEILKKKVLPKGETIAFLQSLIAHLSSMDELIG